ncbi:MAG: histidine kinase, partial [Planctomycetota bacterium]
NASLRVIPVSDGVLISGYVDQADDVRYIMQIAEEYYPRVLNNIRVGGVHQVLLHVKAMEVSRTKLRNLGFDWSIVANNGLFTSGASGLIDAASGVITGSPTARFDILGGSSDFFGVLEALRQDNLAKMLAEPTLVTTSGRPAFFQAGGEVPIPVPQGLGTVAIEYKEWGVRVDFVPIVLGGGRIHLEVRPRVSTLDYAQGTDIQGTFVPGLKKQEVDTGVQMQAGQTLAIAGLVKHEIESTRRGIPWVSDLPYAGALFRRVEEKNNEIELLIFVTPELVDAMDAEEVPPCGPGSRTTSPSDWELGLRGHIEVPKCCPPGAPGTNQGEPGPIMPPGQILTPAPSEPSAPQPSAGSFPDRLPRQVSSGRPSSRPVTIATGSAPDLPGFMGPIGYDVAE